MKLVKKGAFSDEEQLKLKTLQLNASFFKENVSERSVSPSNSGSFIQTMKISTRHKRQTKSDIPPSIQQDQIIELKNNVSSLTNNVNQRRKASQQIQHETRNLRNAYKIEITKLTDELTHLRSKIQQVEQATGQIENDRRKMERQTVQSQKKLEQSKSLIKQFASLMIESMSTLSGQLGAKSSVKHKAQVVQKHSEVIISRLAEIQHKFNLNLEPEIHKLHPSNSKSGKKSIEYCIALSDYESEDSPLRFQRGDIVKVLEKHGNGVSIGELAGKIGNFPSSFVRNMT